MKTTSIISNLFRRVFIVQIMVQLIGIIGNVVDAMVTMKYLGEAAMAAYGLTVTVTMAAAICASILSMGTSMICSKHLGEGNVKQVKHAFSACFTMALLISIVLFLITFLFAVPLAQLMGAKGELIPLTADYLRGYAVGVPGVILVAFLIPVVQMDGKMNQLVMAVAAMTIGEIAADFLVVLVFHGGMFAMGLTIAFSSLLALIILLPHFFKKGSIFRLSSLVFDGHVAAQVLRGGSANAASQFGRMLLTFIMNHILLVHSGSTAVSAHAVITSMGNLCLVPGSAIADTAQMLGGVLCGEEDRKGIVRMMDAGLRLSLLVNFPMLILFQLLAPSLVSLFYQEGAGSMGLVITGFRFYTLCMIFYSVNGMYRCFCQGSGQIREALLLTAMDCLVFPLLAALILEYTLGVPYVWLCYALGEGLLTVLILYYFRKRNPGASGVEAITPFPKDLGANIRAAYEISISENDTGQLSVISEEIRKFCLKSGADRRTAHLIALAAEEAAGNIIEHGFSDGKQHFVDVRVLQKTDGWILRLRDDCRLFDPSRYLEQYTSDDPAANIGLKMLRGISKEIVYLSTLNLNNLIITI